MLKFLQVLLLLFSLLEASSCTIYQFLPSKCPSAGDGGGSDSNGNLVEVSESSVTTDLRESSSSAVCMNIDEALAMLENNDTILLSHGTYTITNFSVDVVRDLSNVSLIGNSSDPEAVIINCSEGTGLFFFNVSELQIVGVTIEQCGIKGMERVNEIFAMTRELVNILYTPLPDFSSALYLVHCPNLLISNTVVRNNRGFGIVGINLIETVTFYRVQVYQNYPSRCVMRLEDFSGSGGGMFLAYIDRPSTGGFRRNNNNDNNRIDDSQLLISESNFTDNYVCRLNEFHVLHNMLPRSVSSQTNLDFSMVGAGGVTLSLGQSNFAVNVQVDSCIFRNNSGTYNGAALHVSLFERSNDSHVLVNNSKFVDNGVRQFGNSGVGPAGAILLFFYTLDPRDYGGQRATARQMAARQLSQNSSTVTISDSTFRGNAARSGGGVCVVSFGPEITFVQDTLTIRNSNFTNNMADFGGALYLTELSYSGFKRGLLAHLHNIRITENLKSAVSAGNTLQSESGAIDISFLNVTMSGSTYIAHNNDTALSLFSAIITISGHHLFEFNTGSTGGGVRLSSESYVVLTEMTNVTFHRNTALISGGAVHVNFDINRFSSYNCFVFMQKLDFFCDLFKRCAPRSGSITIQLINNTAPLGSAIYGSTFSNCPWASDVFSSSAAENSKENVVAGLNSFEPALLFRPLFSLNATNIVNTLPRQIFPRDSGLNFTVMPGKMLQTEVGAFDQLNQSVPLTIYAYLESTDSGDTSDYRASIGITNRYLIDDVTNFTSVPIQVFGSEDLTYNLIITSNEALVEYSIPLLLQNCSLGFFYDNTTSSCECLISDFIDGIICENDGSVTNPNGPWIGFIPGVGFASAPCFFDYCNNSTRVFLDYADSQCRNGRSGIACGKCREGSSRVFGSSSCRECSNASLAMILVFAFLGVLLVVVIALFNATITDGYLNGIIFYSNIMSLYVNNTAMLLPMKYGGIVGRILIGLFNLNFNIESCFYDGMTDIHLALLTYVFPLYLGGIVLVITLVSKYYHNKYFVKLLDKINIMHIFATVLFLSYTSLIRTSIDIITYTDIQVPDGFLRMWKIDPTQMYFHGLHVLALFAAIFFIIVLLPFPLLILFPPVSLSLPYVKRLKPLIDAYIAPFEYQKISWVGFRLIYRNFFYLMILMSDKPRNITICVFLILTTVIEAYVRPFRTTARNVFDLFLMTNLTLVSLLLMINEIADEETAFISSAFAYILLLIFVISVLSLLLYYVGSAFSCTHKVKEAFVNFYDGKITPLLSFLGEKPEKRLSKTGSIFVQSEELSHTSINLDTLKPEREGSGKVIDEEFRTISYVGFREPMLEPSLPTSPNSSSRNSE